MDSPGCGLKDEEEEEELGALVYKWSETARAKALKAGNSADDNDDVEQGAEEDSLLLECDDQSVAQATTNNELSGNQKQPAAPVESQQTLRATAGKIEIGEVQNHHFSIEQKRQRQQPQPSIVGNGDQIIDDRFFVRRSTRKRSPIVQLLKSADMSEEVQVKLSGEISKKRRYKQSSTKVKQYSAEVREEFQLEMAGGATKKRKHEQSSTRVKRVRRKCSAEGCTNIAVKGDICLRHGAVRRILPRPKCSAEGCTNVAVKGGVCFRHGANRQRLPRRICSAEGCTNMAKNGGICYRHGAVRRKCSVEGCTNIDQKGGVCKKHGAQKKPKEKCYVEGCTNDACQMGVCVRHGAASPVRKICSVERCTNDAVQKGVCIQDGADTSKEVELKSSGENSEMADRVPKKREDEQPSTKVKRVRRICSAEGCTNIAQRDRVCSRHGGGKPKCSVEGCTNHIQQGGVCFKHRAQKKPKEKCYDRVQQKREDEQPSTKVKRVRRKCSAEGCTNVAVKGGLCFKHGAPRKPNLCSAEGCTNHAQKGGVCMRHGAQRKPNAKCYVKGCTNYSKQSGVCVRHGAPSQVRKICSVERCTNNAIQKGVCIRHGASSWVRKLCSDPSGCKNNAQKGGVCRKHGATLVRKPCPRM